MEPKDNDNAQGQDEQAGDNIIPASPDDQPADNSESEGEGAESSPDDSQETPEPAVEEQPVQAKSKAELKDEALSLGLKVRGNPSQETLQRMIDEAKSGGAAVAANQDSGKQDSEKAEEFEVIKSADGRTLEAQIGDKRWSGTQIKVPAELAGTVRTLLIDGGYDIK